MTESFIEFAETYQLYEGESCIRSDATPPPSHLPKALQRWLLVAPADSIRVAGDELAGSVSRLAKWRAHESSIPNTRFVIFGYTEDGGGFLALGTDAQNEEAELFVIDHETNQHRSVGPFTERLESYIAHMKGVLARGL
jgi:hypothetical protein